MKKQFAPVVIPTLCRYEHLKSCLESLASCSYSEETEVYICIDYPKYETHRDGYNMICNYLDSVKLPFKHLYVIKRTENLGEWGNLLSIYKDVIFKKYNSWILTEDDNVFSPNFLEYMNYQLGLYEYDSTVFAVNGYSFPLDYNYKGQCTYKTYMFSPWGCGFWTSKFYIDTEEEADGYLKNAKTALKIFFKSSYLFETLVSMRYNGKFYGDAVLRARCMINGLTCITPVVSKVRNCGYDNSGLNCQDDGGAHLAQSIDRNIHYSHLDLVNIPNLYVLFSRYFNVSIKRIMKAIIQYFIYVVKL